MSWVNLDNFRKVLGNLNQVRFSTETVDGTDFTICSYMVSDPEIWKSSEGMEARGITFDEFGEVACRPFEKFFNLNEREDTQEHIIMEEYGKPGTRLFEKRDGSMLTPVLVNGHAVFKTKKSFFSDVALQAQEFAETIPGFLEACEDLLLWGMTPIFEFTSPSCPIVVDYGDKPQFTLLAIRDMFEDRYYYPDDVTTGSHYWDKLHMVEHIKEYKFLPTWKDLRDAQASYEGMEGWIIVLPSGKRVKLKTEWYMSRHRLLDIRPRDIAVSVVEEEYDDLVSGAVDRGLDIEIFRSVQTQVLNEFASLKDHVDLIVNLVVLKLGSIKNQYELTEREYFKKAAEIAFDFDKEYAPSAMIVLRGREPDYKKMWYQTFHKSYGLRSVFNNNFGRDNE